MSRRLPLYCSCRDHRAYWGHERRLIFKDWLIQRSLHRDDTTGISIYGILLIYCREESFQLMRQTFNTLLELFRKSTNAWLTSSLPYTLQEGGEERDTKWPVRLAHRLSKKQKSWSMTRMSPAGTRSTSSTRQQTDELHLPDPSIVCSGEGVSRLLYLPPRQDIPHIRVKKFD